MILRLFPRVYRSTLVPAANVKTCQQAPTVILNFYPTANAVLVQIQDQRVDAALIVLVGIHAIAVGGKVLPLLYDRAGQSYQYRLLLAKTLRNNAYHLACIYHGCMRSPCTEQCESKD